MANTVDENLRKFLLDDSAIVKLVGSRIHKNHVPQSIVGDYIWFARESSDDEICLDDAAGSGPFRRFYDFEAVAKNHNANADRIADALYDRLHKYVGAFGDSTVKLILCEEQDEQYVPRNVGGDTGLHVPSLRVQVIP